MFLEYGQTLANVRPFNNLGRLLSSNNYDWPKVADNLRKLWNTWMRVSRIVGWQGADAKAYGIFFKALVQSILLFSSEMWAMDPCLL